MACEVVQRNGRVCGRTNCLIHAQGDPNEVCSICLEQFGLGYVKNLECGHTFHKRCFSEWSHRAHTCPTCRQPFRQLPRFRVETIVNVYENGVLLETHRHESEHIPLIALEVLMDDMGEVDAFVREEIINTE